MKLFKAILWALVTFTYSFGLPLVLLFKVSFVALLLPYPVRLLITYIFLFGGLILSLKVFTDKLPKKTNE